MNSVRARSAQALAVVIVVATAGACTGSGGERSTAESLSPLLLDYLAPTSGDAFEHATVVIESALVKRRADALESCVRAEGVPVQPGEVRDLLLERTPPPLLISPAALRRYGFVSVAPPETVNGDRTYQALLKCREEKPRSGDTNAARVAAFETYRDSDRNPAAGFSQRPVEEEMKAVAAGGSAAAKRAAECFAAAGVPAEEARNEDTAVLWAAGRASSEFDGSARAPTDSEYLAWRRGEGVLDADGGRLARTIADCVELFEKDLTPRLERRRDALVEDHLDAFLEGQRLLQAAVGDDSPVLSGESSSGGSKPGG